MSSSWHDKSTDAVLAELGAAPDGLADSEAQKRLLAAGPNRLPETRRRT